MTDYIKRDDALEEFEYRDSYSATYVRGFLKHLPSADVAPVRHGHWVFNQEDMTLHCSCCDEVFRFEEDEKDECLDFMEYAKYCLACGAVMDEEVDA